MTNQVLLNNDLFDRVNDSSFFINLFELNILKKTFEGVSQLTSGYFSIKIYLVLQCI